MWGKNETDQIKQMFKLLGQPDMLIWLSWEDIPLVWEGAMDLLHDRNQFSKFPRLLDNFSYLSAAGFFTVTTFILWLQEKTNRIGGIRVRLF